MTAEGGDTLERSKGHVLFFKDEGEQLELYRSNGLHYAAPASAPVGSDGRRSGTFRCGRNPEFDQLLREHLTPGARVADGHGRPGTYHGPADEAACLVAWDHGAESPVRSSYRSISTVLE